MSAPGMAALAAALPAWVQSAQIVRLAEAVLCEDCRCVTNATSERCLACGSRAVFSLIRLLEGGTEGREFVGEMECEHGQHRQCVKDLKDE